MRECHRMQVDASPGVSDEQCESIIRQMERLDASQTAELVAVAPKIGALSRPQLQHVKERLRFRYHPSFIEKLAMLGRGMIAEYMIRLHVSVSYLRGLPEAVLRELLDRDRLVEVHTPRRVIVKKLGELTPAEFQRVVTPQGILSASEQWRRQVPKPQEKVQPTCENATGITLRGNAFFVHGRRVTLRLPVEMIQPYFQEKKKM